jgi:hypothetical protein
MAGACECGIESLFYHSMKCEGFLECLGDC